MDPFLYNVLPQSLLVTVVWVLAVAVFAIVLSRFVWRLMNQFALEALEEAEEEEKKKEK